jgi:hypothetical protein
VVLTPFFPIFLVMLIIAFRSPKSWVVVSLVASVFQGATPILLAAGGRPAGINPAYVLLIAGVWHWFGIQLKSLNHGGGKASAMKLDRSFFFLAFFTVVGVGGALLLPRIFDGSVRILPTRLGLDSGQTEMVAPSGTNYIQSFYLFCNFALAGLVYYFRRCGLFNDADFARALKIAVLVVLGIGFYQLAAFWAALPWPDAVINSNIGVKQLYEQTALGVRRMSATFLEPSFLAMHMLIVFGYFGLGLGRWLIAALIGLALLASTSSSAYVGLLVLVAIWAAWDAKRIGWKLLPALLLVCGVAVALLALDYVVFEGQFFQRLVFDKLDAGSGKVRQYADYLALKTFSDSYGLGVGVGSTRASSFLATLLATTGIIGFLSFVALFFSIFSGLLCRHDEDRAIRYALVAACVGWLLSVPDIALPMVWIFVGVGMAASASRRASS